MKKSMRKSRRMRRSRRSVGGEGFLGTGIGKSVGSIYRNFKNRDLDPEVKELLNDYHVCSKSGKKSDKCQKIIKEYWDYQRS